ncbi:SDR family oxidoreductase [Serratia proteamaculans]|uniref:SDR family NAD(P)-dependent oxidoreductase n=1 Tax=Serratia proteamaculans TaxID=28151 RepID=UPI0015769A74|nr:SDR family oxidoreductase [Serratia proteamaculans]NTX81026.1 SDR family oxidoreductase [Serratia proteamaculans]NTZ30228.1 SDR family oxidoreductase [Serratia proteamaculans]
MIIDNSKRKALITGATSGIGFAAAKGLLETGADVYINGRNPEKLATALQRLNITDSSKGILADVGTAAGCAALIEQLPQVDILVNNAGIFSPQPLVEIDDEEWFKFINVNFMSGVRLTRHYMPQMQNAGWGRVVFVSSESAIQVPPEMVHYAVTKTAQLTLARGFAEVAKNTNVTVNSILPGPTMSEGVERFVREMVPDQSVPLDEAGRIFIRNERSTSLLGRMASADEVANLIVYLSSELASATTGTAVRVDGGVLRGII